MNTYPTDLTDNQWQSIEKFFDCERKRKYPLREIWNAILYVVKTGCQWRMLPGNFASWQSVYYYFRTWKYSGIIEAILKPPLSSSFPDEDANIIAFETL
jgi:putative transposase